MYPNVGEDDCAGNVPAGDHIEMPHDKWFFYLPRTCGQAFQSSCVRSSVAISVKRNDVQIMNIGPVDPLTTGAYATIGHLQLLPGDVISIEAFVPDTPLFGVTAKRLTLESPLTQVAIGMCPAVIPGCHAH